jgi:hypothetical protein
MFSSVLRTNPDLLCRSRVRAAYPAALQADWIDAAVLIAMGVIAAALTTFVHLRMRIPGHAIVLSVIPMSFGLAAAPRRGAGGLMGLSAVLATIGFDPAGAPTRVAALVSLGLVGVLLDLAARRAQCGKKLYVAFAVAGLASNAVAFGAKMLEKRSGLDVGSRPYAEWISIAPLSFALCGLLAGLIGAALFFQFSEAGKTGPHQEPRA